MAQTVDLAGAVARLAVENAIQIRVQRRVVRSFADVFADIAEHLHDLGVRTAVERALQRADCARNGAVGVGAGRSHGAADEGGVVAGMLGMENEHEVEQMRFLRRVGRIGADHAQNILGDGQLRLRIVQDEGVSVKIMPLGGKGVRRDEREARDEADGLPQNVVQRGIVRTVVIGIEGEDAAGQLVHDVAAGGLEDHVLGEPGWHGACAGHDVVEALLLRLRGQRAEQQQIRDLLIAERAAFPMGLDNILDADAAVIELAGHGNAFAVHHIIALHAADLADADEHARAVRVAQAALDALVFKILRGDGILLRNVFTQMGDVGFKKRCHGSGPPADLLPILYRSGSKNARARFRLCRIFFEFLRIRKQCDELCNMNF